jgi:hypothetical protein
MSRTRRLLCCCGTLLVLSLLWLTAAHGQDGGDGVELEPIKVQAARQQFYDHLLPPVPRPALDPGSQHKKLSGAIAAWQAAVADGDDTAARQALLEAMDKHAARLTTEGWLLYAELRLTQAQAAQEQAMMDGAENPPLDLAPAREAWDAAAAEGDRAAATWASYGLALATTFEDEDESIEALEAVAGGAVPALEADALLRLGSQYADPAKSADALDKAMKRAEGQRKGRAAVELSTRAFLAGEIDRAIELAIGAIAGQTFRGDDERALRLAVEGLALRGGDPTDGIPTGTDGELAASVLAALGDYWLRGRVGQHPVEALAAYEAAASRSPGAATAETCRSGADEARTLLEDPQETVEQWGYRISALCFDRALTVDPSLNCAADIHLVPGSPSPTLEVEVREASSRGRKALEACFTGPLPAPLVGGFAEQDLLVLLDNY